MTSTERRKTRPDVVSDIHRAYLDAGAGIIETNTFGGTHLVRVEYQVEKRQQLRDAPLQAAVGRNGALPGRKRTQRNERKVQDQSMAAGCILNRTVDSKMEISPKLEILAMG